MSKSKKQQRNGFYYYMLDMQQELREQGRNVRMSEMPVLAGPRWSKLSDGQKQAYSQRAKHEKRAGGVSGITLQMATAPRPGRMDCTGVLLSVSFAICSCFFFWGGGGGGGGGGAGCFGFSEFSNVARIL